MNTPINPVLAVEEARRAGLIFRAGEEPPPPIIWPTVKTPQEAGIAAVPPAPKRERKPKPSPKPARYVTYLKVFTIVTNHGKPLNIMSPV